MKHLKRFNENNSNLLLELEDIFVDLRDEGFEVLIEDGMFLDRKSRPVYLMIFFCKENINSNGEFESYKEFHLSDIKEDMIRVIKYLENEGRELVKIEPRNISDIDEIKIPLKSNKWDLNIELETIHFFFK